MVEHFFVKSGDKAAVGKLIKDEFYLRMQHPALTVSIGIADQTNEQEAKNKELRKS